MKKILIVVLLLILEAYTKTVSKIIRLRDFDNIGNTVFITKFYIGVGSASIDISYTYKIYKLENKDIY